MAKNGGETSRISLKTVAALTSATGASVEHLSSIAVAAAWPGHGRKTRKAGTANKWIAKLSSSWLVKSSAARLICNRSWLCNALVSSWPNWEQTRDSAARSGTSAGTQSARMKSNTGREKLRSKRQLLLKALSRSHRLEERKKRKRRFW